MNTTSKAVRRGLYVVFAASAAGGATVAALAVPSATAAPDPCAASQVARTIGSVATSTGNYLDSHPETNQALTTISQQQGGPASLGALKN
jgi:heme-binding protein